LEVAVPLDLLHFAGLHRPTATTAIAEMTVRAAGPLAVQIEIERLMHLLCLFGLGSVTHVGYTINGRTILRPTGIFQGSQQSGAIYRFGLTKGDEELWGQFSKRVRPSLFAASSASPSDFIAAHFAAPMHRYRDALLQPTIVESRITSAITCLESLFLKAKERSELSHRLGQRVAMLLRVAGFKPAQAYGRIHDAYEIRSDFIHGGMTDTTKAVEYAELCETIVEYARLSLLTFVELSPKVDKDTLIKILDQSLLDDQKVTGLSDILQGVLAPMLTASRRLADKNETVTKLTDVSPKRI
jgi:hypothetical protein